MTEQLRQLLHDETSRLVVPAPDPARLVRDGRRLRRRQRVTTGFAAVATAVAIAATGVVGWQATNDGRSPDSARAPAAPLVYGVGSRVYLDDRVVELPGSVRSLHVTSTGVLVRSTPEAGGPDTLTRVLLDGSSAGLGSVPRGPRLATDPDEPVYVLAESRSGGVVAVVRDARSGRTLEEVALPDFPSSPWEVPPLSLDDQTLYVGYRTLTIAIDLATRARRTVEGMPGGSPVVLDGRWVGYEPGRLTVNDVRGGQPLFGVGWEQDGEGSLSPDGRYFLLLDDDLEMDAPPPTFDVYTVDSGAKVEIPGSPYSWGWRADGMLFRVYRDTITTCDPTNGRCADSPAPAQFEAGADVRYPGPSYTS